MFLNKEGTERKGQMMGYITCTFGHLGKKCKEGRRNKLIYKAKQIKWWSISKERKKKKDFIQSSAANKLYKGFSDTKMKKSSLPNVEA